MFCIDHAFMETAKITDKVKGVSLWFAIVLSKELLVGTKRFCSKLGLDYRFVQWPSTLET